MATFPLPITLWDTWILQDGTLRWNAQHASLAEARAEAKAIVEAPDSQVTGVKIVELPSATAPEQD